MAQRTGANSADIWGNTASDGSREDYEAHVDSNGALRTGDLYLDIARGLISGETLVNKFGQNSDLNTSTFEDIWDVGGVYNYPADDTAPITHIVSTDVGDTSDCSVQGLDINGELTIISYPLTGTTPVELTTPLWRVFRMRNDGDTDYAGVISVTNTAGTVTYAQITNGNNQTLMALFTIPAGKTGLLVQGTTSLTGVTRSVSASGRFWARPFGGVFQLKHTFGVGSDGGSVIVPFTLPMKLPEKTDLRVDALGSANGVQMNATFSIILIDN